MEAVRGLSRLAAGWQQAGSRLAAGWQQAGTKLALCELFYRIISKTADLL
jgi:hypothetical protein